MAMEVNDLLQEAGRLNLADLAVGEGARLA